jgi:transposase InsO family protein
MPLTLNLQIDIFDV